jgi:hypothetical protein
MNGRYTLGLAVVYALLAGCMDTAALENGPNGAGTSAPGASSADSGVQSNEVTTGPPGVADGGSFQSPADGGSSTTGVDAGPQVTAPSWMLYSNSDSAPNQWNAVPLSSVWTGTNAPPATGIRAAAQLDDFNHLLVWADDGNFYVRISGAWQTPKLTASEFPALAGRDFRGCYHQPSQPSTPAANKTESLGFVDNPTAFLYDYHANGNVSHVQDVTMTDEGGQYGAPKATKKARWVMRTWAPGQFGTAAYLAEYSGYDNDAFVYFYDATPAPTNKWAFADAPIFKGKTNVPSQANIMVAWRDDALGTNYLIVR